METNDNVNNFGHQKQEVVDFLKGYGYVIYRYDANRNQVYPTNIDDRVDNGNNFLVIAESEIEFVRRRLQNIS